MEIIVLGAGAIGSLYGAKLAAKNDVTLVARAKHVDAINANGLHVEGLESHIVRVRADTAAALATIAPLVRDDTTIVSLQNGLDSERIARRALGSRGVVLRGITQFGAIFKSAGVIEFMARGYTLLEKHERSDRIAPVLNDAGLDCRISQNIARDVWHKLVINCVVNPITAILGCEVGGIANPQLDPLKKLVIDECIAVANAE